MLGAEVVVFPDCGESFRRSLKTNALYAKRVHSSIPIIPEEFIARGLESVQSARLGVAGGKYPPGCEEALAYVDFVLREQQSLRLMEQAGVLSATTPAAYLRLWSLVKQKRLHADGQEQGSVDPALLERFKTADPTLIACIRRARRQRQPSVLDVLPLLAVGDPDRPSLEQLEASLQRNETPPELALFWLVTREDDLDLPGFGIVLAFANALLEQHRVPFVCTDPILQQGLWAAHRVLSPSASSPAHSQEQGREELLATTILETHLPIVHDLPIEEILNFRERHEDELEAFRSGVGELAVSIDVSQPGRDVERQCRDLVLSRVNPAVRDLRAKLKNARLESLQKIGRSWQAVAGLTFSTSVAVLAGAPLDISAVVGLLGAIGQAFLDGEIERRKLLHASQWSALIRFDELS